MIVAGKDATLGEVSALLSEAQEKLAVRMRQWDALEERAAATRAWAADAAKADRDRLSLTALRALSAAGKALPLNVPEVVALDSKIKCRAWSEQAMPKGGRAGRSTVQSLRKLLARGEELVAEGSLSLAVRSPEADALVSLRKRLREAESWEERNGVAPQRSPLGAGGAEGAASPLSAGGPYGAGGDGDVGGAGAGALRGRRGARGEDGGDVDGEAGSSGREDEDGAPAGRGNRADRDSAAPRRRHKRRRKHHHSSRKAKEAAAAAAAASGDPSAPPLLTLAEARLALSAAAAGAAVPGGVGSSEEAVVLRARVEAASMWAELAIESARDFRAPGSREQMRELLENAGARCDALASFERTKAFSSLSLRFFRFTPNAFAHALFCA